MLSNGLGLELHRDPYSQASVCTSSAGLCVALALLLALFCGCESSSPDTMANAYYLNRYESLRDLGRVILAELDNPTTYPEISRDVTKALFLQLQKKQVFSLTTVGRDDPTWAALQGDPDSPQAMKALLTIRENTRCNGLLVGTITEYRPYPRLTVGLRLKLLDLSDGQLLWGVEQVWDSTDRNVQKRIKAYFSKEVRSGSSVNPVPQELIAISPLEFVKFAAYEVAQTLDAKKK